jgi:F-type H+-transporting ATPase subunit b
MSKLVALLRRTAPLAVALFCVPFSAMAEEGMPQLDFGNKLTISQMVWLVIIFPVFYLLVSRWALPQVGAVIEMRAARIAQDLDAARAAKVEADAAVAEQTTAIRAAQTGAQTEIANAVAKAKQEAAAEAATLNARLDAQISEAEQRIDVARTTALGALRQVASETTMAVVLRLTGAAPNAAVVEQAVGAQLAARGQ